MLQRPNRQTQNIQQSIKKQTVYIYYDTYFSGPIDIHIPRRKGSPHRSAKSRGAEDHPARRPFGIPRRAITQDILENYRAKKYFLTILKNKKAPMTHT